VENPSSRVLSSPCDGRVLTISEVKNLKDLIIVKDVKYTLGEFLFGKFREAFPALSENIYNQEKKFYQITIYLSPGDCHRYYSPNNIQVSDRVYIPGFLEPVRPSYLDKHPMVFQTNERVTLKCTQEASDDLLFITYVGALNVGSISLSFDDFLRTNVKLTPQEKKDPGFYVVKYTDILTPSQKKMERPFFHFYRPAAPLLFQDLDSESSEFDMRDMIDLDQDIVTKFKIDLADVKVPFYLFKERFLFEKIIREREELPLTFGNSFLSYDLETHKKKLKLNNPKQLNLEKFKMSDKGVCLEKKEEMGWFNFGSTIVLIFSVDKDKEIKFMHKAGEVVKIGQTLFDYI
jgi:phosphatidylserine decarboxylase precursor